MNRIITSIIAAIITTTICFLVKDYKETCELVKQNEIVKNETDALCKHSNKDIEEMKLLERKLDDLLSGKTNKSVEQLIQYFSYFKED